MKMSVLECYSQTDGDDHFKNEISFANSVIS
jgi:hypothetical protein